MIDKTILRTWVVAPVGCTIAAIAVYAMMSQASGNVLQQSIAYFLFPA